MLRLESGINDVLLLPIVVIAMLVIAAGGSMSARSITSHAAGLFVLGPLLGAGVGWAGISLLEAIRSRVGVRRDYESLYALGVAFSAYAAAEWVGGSGFLAAFAAGLTIADDTIATNALRFTPDDAVKKAKEMQLSSRGTLVVYCA